MRSARIAAGLVIAASGILALSGCDVLEPTRDADGRIVKPTVMPTVEAWVGDCFSFVENSNLAYATVTPCSEPHTHIVMDTGSFSEAKLVLAGGRDNAVNAACDKAYDSFVAAVADGVEREPQSIMSSEKKAGGVVTYYSCLATDPAVVAADG